MNEVTFTVKTIRTVANFMFEKRLDYGVYNGVSDHRFKGVRKGYKTNDIFMALINFTFIQIIQSIYAYYYES